MSGLGLPPVSFGSPVDASAPAESRPGIAEPLQRKRMTAELSLDVLIPELDRFMQAVLEQHGGAFYGLGRPCLRESGELRDGLNGIFREAIQGDQGTCLPCTRFKRLNRGPRLGRLMAEVDCMCASGRLSPLPWMGTGGAVAVTAGGKDPNGSGSEAVPTLALRSGLCGEFVDFGLLPALIAELDPASHTPAVSRWAGLLNAGGFDSRHMDPDDGRSASTIAAEGAWRLANRIGLVREGQATEAGHAVAALAGIDAEACQDALAPLLQPGVEAALAGQGGKPIIPLLERAAQALAASNNLWVRVCPALIPIEVGAIVHWACIDFRHAEALVKDIEINRDVAMHRGGPPDPGAPPGTNLERHFERVMEFYFSEPRIGGQVPLSFGEEHALAKLLGFCGLLRESASRPEYLVLQNR